MATRIFTDDIPEMTLTNGSEADWMLTPTPVLEMLARAAGLASSECFRRGDAFEGDEWEDVARMASDELRSRDVLRGGF